MCDYGHLPNNGNWGHAEQRSAERLTLWLMRSSAAQSDSPCDSPCVAPLHSCTQCASCTQLISVLASTLGADEVGLIATAAHVPPLGLQIGAHGVCYVINALLVLVHGDTVHGRGFASMPGSGDRVLLLGSYPYYYLRSLGGPRLNIESLLPDLGT